jgi:hypothetical protein
MHVYSSLLNPRAGGWEKKLLLYLNPSLLMLNAGLNQTLKLFVALFCFEEACVLKPVC